MTSRTSLRHWLAPEDYARADAAEAVAQENAEAAGWAWFAAFGLACFIGGMLAVIVPALVIAWFVA